MKKVATVLCLSCLATLLLVCVGTLTKRNPVSACNPDKLPIYLIGTGSFQDTPSAPSNECEDVTEREQVRFGLLQTVVKSAVEIYYKTQSLN